MTGARILTTLINGLQTMDATYGLETMCVGGGMGMAMIIERDLVSGRSHCRRVQIRVDLVDE